jgi:hypothetical protein
MIFYMLPAASRRHMYVAMYIFKFFSSKSAATVRFFQGWPLVIRSLLLYYFLSFFSFDFDNDSSDVYVCVLCNLCVTSRVLLYTSIRGSGGRNRSILPILWIVLWPSSRSFYNTAKCTILSCHMSCQIIYIS